MSGTQNKGETILTFYQKLNHKLHKMNDPHNAVNHDDGINCKLLQPVEAHNQVIFEIPGDGAVRRPLPVTRLKDFYRGNIKITYSDGILYYLHYHRVIDLCN